jgi:type II secretory pathway pseudopilin PulG
MDTLHKQLTPPKTKGRDGSLSDPSARRGRGTSCPKPQATLSPSPFPIPHSPFRISHSPFRIPHFAFPKSELRSPISGLRSPGAQRPSAIRPPLSAIGGSAASAFTLIESVVAIGIFAFVIVGIVGLFGAALERQRQASFETRAVMVSQQILAGIRSASSAGNATFVRGSDPATQSKLFHTASFTAPGTNTLVFYYKKDGTEISGLLATNNYTNNTYSYFPGYPAEPSPQDIVGRARVILTTNNTGTTNLYRINIEVSEPANLPLAARRYTNTFSTLATFPN